VSLSQEPAYSDLKNHFVCGYRNIMGERYAGNSGTHTTRGNAVDTTNGAGPHNIQMFVLNPDGTVLHCLPGYWNPQDLSTELAFARQVNDLYVSNSVSPADKIRTYGSMEMNHFRQHSPDMVARSKLQNFDMKFEATHRLHNSDFIKNAAILDGTWNRGSEAAFRTTDEVLHYRMALRPFLSYNHFDVGKFADYGQHTYDKHEDSLDEYGHLVGSHDVHWIKDAGAGRAERARNRQLKAQSAPKVYVRNYGQVKTNNSASN
jgi:hypothetical protein